MKRVPKFYSRPLGKPVLLVLVPVRATERGPRVSVTDSGQCWMDDSVHGAVMALWHGRHGILSVAHPVRFGYADGPVAP